MLQYVTLRGAGPGGEIEASSWVSNEIDNPESMLDPSLVVTIVHLLISDWQTYICSLLQLNQIWLDITSMTHMNNQVGFDINIKEKLVLVI